MDKEIEEMLRYFMPVQAKINTLLDRYPAIAKHLPRIANPEDLATAWGKAAAMLDWRPSTWTDAEAEAIYEVRRLTWQFVYGGNGYKANESLIYQHARSRGGDIPTNFDPITGEIVR